VCRQSEVQGDQLTSAERAKDKRLRDIYNTTLEAQNEQRAKQGNRCAICRRDFAKFTAFQDHEHKCCPRRLKKFCGRCNRSLLCFSCNKFVVGVLERQSVDGKKLNPLWLLKQIIAYFEYWNPILKAKGCYEEKPKEKTAVSRKKKRIR
jgi:hypothetical protein